MHTQIKRTEKCVRKKERKKLRQVDNLYLISIKVYYVCYANKCGDAMASELLFNSCFGTTSIFWIVLLCDSQTEMLHTILDGLNFDVNENPLKFDVLFFGQIFF